MLKIVGPRVYIGFKIISFFLLFSILLRLAFAFYFYPIDKFDFVTSDFLKAIYLGIKFDLRVSILLSLPYLVLSLIPKLNPTNSNNKKNSKFFWLIIYTLLSFILSQIYFLDFGYYDYLKDRLNATVLQFLDNLFISLEMVWQTYPIFWVTVLSLALIYIFYVVLKKFVFTFPSEPDDRSKLQKWVFSFLIFIFLVIGMYGKFSYYPLRWSEVFFSGDRYIAALGTNPLHYFFDTLTNRSKNYDLNLVREHYNLVSTYLGVDEPDIKNLNFKRIQKPIAPLKLNRPNVIVIIMESLSAHRSGLFGNKSDATPVLDSLGNNGWNFLKNYTPSEGTARGVFATVTGVADINKDRTSSRNPLIVDQNTAANYLTNYERYYFIGGSANWGNIRGVLENNIKNLKLYEEGMFDSPRTDVWGVSDYHLFKETARILNMRENKNEPYLAFIQTAGFHRPYTIPEDRGDFTNKDLSLAELKKWGFESLEEYNSMRFTDYSLRVFIEEMQKQEGFDNTLFVILGDHGLPDNQAQNLTPTEIRFSIERFHTPLIFYMPSQLKPQTFEFVVSQQDILPTIAALTGHTFINKGIGRNIFDPQFINQRFIFSYVYYRNPHTIFLFDNDYFVTGTPQNITSMYKYTSPEDPEDINSQFPEKFEQMSDLLNGLYETTKYILHNNKKEF